MPIQDRLAAAKQIDQFLKTLITHGHFRLKYRITAGAKQNGEGAEWEQPEILVELAGPDSPLLIERGGELLRSMEHVSAKILRLEADEHEKVSFDSMNFKAMRAEELRLAAEVAAEKVRKSGQPYEFSPMSSRERRIVHLVMRNWDDLKTESAGEGPHRYVVVYPRDYNGKPVTPRAGGFPARRRR